MIDGDHTRLLRALLSAVTDLDELPHPRHAGRVLLAAAVEGKGCSDDAVARAALITDDGPSAVPELTHAKPFFSRAGEKSPCSDFAQSRSSYGPRSGIAIANIK